MRYQTSKSGDEYSSIQEYVDRMKKGQNYIEYTNECAAVVSSSAYLASLTKKGLEILYMCDPIDEFVVRKLKEYDGKQLKSAVTDGLDIDDDDEKKKQSLAATKSATVQPEAGTILTKEQIELCSRLRRISFKTYSHELMLLSQLLEKDVCETCVNCESVVYGKHQNAVSQPLYCWSCCQAVQYAYICPECAFVSCTRCHSTYSTWPQ